MASRRPPPGRRSYRSDGGVDPRKTGGTPSGPGRTGRKLMQLCSQVAETLGAVLAGETGDELLQDLEIVEVIPDPDATSLRVLLRAPDGLSAEEFAELAEHLHSAHGFLRTQVASAVSRRKSPQLALQLLKPSQLPPSPPAPPPPDAGAV